MKTLPIVYQNKPFELQPEDGFINKPKRVGNLTILIIFLYNNGCIRLKTCIHFINPIPNSFVYISFQPLTSQATS